MGYGNYDYGYSNDLISTASTGSSFGTWSIIALVVAVVGGFLAYFLFVVKPKAKEYSNFVSWLHDFLNCKVMFISAILKIAYMICAIFLTLWSFAFIGTSALAFFGMLIFGNLLLRICYELLMLTITLIDNTTEINKKLKGKEEK